MEPERNGTAFWVEMRWLVAVIAAVLLMPPILGLFDRPLTVFGIPLLPFFIFAVWALAIVLCAMVSQRTRLGRDGADEPGA